MTQVLNITRAYDGQYHVTDGSGHLVDGPFATNAEAWEALDSLNVFADQVKPPRSKKRVLWGKRTKKSKKARKAAKRMKRNAAKAPARVRTGAAALFGPVAMRAYRDHKLGTFGAASEVRRIDPTVYLAEKAARGET